MTNQKIKQNEEFVVRGRKKSVSHTLITHRNLENPQNDSE